MKSRFHLAAVVLLVSGVLSGLVSAQTYVNPVITDSADPGVYYHAANGYYYVYATDYRFHRSTNLVNWTAIGNPLNDSGTFWAPEVFKRQSDGFLYMFYTMNQRLRVAKSSSPAGPFNPIATDLTGRWSIDSSYFRDDDGKEYIYWNEGGCAGTSGVWVGELNSTLTSISNPQHCFNDVHRYLHKFWVATADPKHGLAASVPLPGSWVARNHWGRAPAPGSVWNGTPTSRKRCSFVV